jgi:hypothetical protein
MTLAPQDKVCAFCDFNVGDKPVYCCKNHFVTEACGGHFEEKGGESLHVQWNAKGSGAIHTHRDVPVTARGFWEIKPLPQYSKVPVGVTCSLCTPRDSRSEYHAVFCLKCCHDYTNRIVNAIDNIAGSGAVFSVVHVTGATCAKNDTCNICVVLGTCGNLVSFHSSDTCAGAEVSTCAKNDTCDICVVHGTCGLFPLK